MFEGLCMFLAEPDLAGSSHGVGVLVVLAAFVVAALLQVAVEAGEALLAEAHLRA